MVQVGFEEQVVNMHDGDTFAHTTTLVVEFDLRSEVGRRSALTYDSAFDFWCDSEHISAGERIAGGDCKRVVSYGFH